MGHDKVDQLLSSVADEADEDAPPAEEEVETETDEADEADEKVEKVTKKAKKKATKKKVTKKATKKKVSKKAVKKKEPKKDTTEELDEPHGDDEDEFEQDDEFDDDIGMPRRGVSSSAASSVDRLMGGGQPAIDPLASTLMGKTDTTAPAVSAFSGESTLSSMMNI